MDELKTELLEQLKSIKGIKEDETASDDVFLFVLKATINEIMNYCHFEVDEFPKGLYEVAVFMAIEKLNEISFTANFAEEGEGETKRLTEGDFSIEKETKADVYQKIMKAPSFVKSYKRQLNNFRRLA